MVRDCMPNAAEHLSGTTHKIQFKFFSYWNLFRKSRKKKCTNWNIFGKGLLTAESIGEVCDDLTEKSRVRLISKVQSFPKGIVQFWLRRKAPPYGEIHWPPPCCTTRTRHYLLDLQWREATNEDIASDWSEEFISSLRGSIWFWVDVPGLRHFQIRTWNLWADSGHC